MSGSGTRIASISGLRGVVGDGTRPGGRRRVRGGVRQRVRAGPIVVGHDGRVSAPVFMAAVEAGVTATGHDALLAGPTATPTIGVLVRDHRAAGGIQISASHNPPEYNGLKFFQRAGMVLSQAQGPRVLDRWQRREFRWASWESLGRARTARRSRSRATSSECSASSTCAAIARRGFKVVLDACHGAGGRLGDGDASGARLPDAWSWVVSPTAATTIRPNRPRRT